MGVHQPHKLPTDFENAVLNTAADPKQLAEFERSFTDYLDGNAPYDDLERHTPYYVTPEMTQWDKEDLGLYFGAILIHTLFCNYKDVTPVALEALQRTIDDYGVMGYEAIAQLKLSKTGQVQGTRLKLSPQTEPHIALYTPKHTIIFDISHAAGQSHRNQHVTIYKDDTAHAMLSHDTIDDMAFDTLIHLITNPATRLSDFGWKPLSTPSTPLTRYTKK